MIPVDTSVDIKSVELVNQVRLCYAEQGDSSGVPIVFLHGATDSWRSFERVLPHLPESIRAFAVTQRGHGDSSRPATGYCPRDFAADLAGFMDALKAEDSDRRRTLHGWPGCSTFCARLSRANAGSGTGRNPSNDATQTRGAGTVGLRRLEAGDPVDRSFVVEFQESTLAQPVPAAFFETVIQESLEGPDARLEGGICRSFGGGLFQAVLAESKSRR